MLAFWEYEKFSWQNVAEKVNAKKIDVTPVGRRCKPLANRENVMRGGKP